jgi:hypothetical protein
MTKYDKFVLHVIAGEEIYMYKDRNDFSEHVIFESPNQLITKSINGICSARLFDHGDATGELDFRLAAAQMWINGFVQSSDHDNHEQFGLVNAPAFSVPSLGSASNDKAHVLRMELTIPKNPGTIWNGDFHVLLYEDVNFEEDFNSGMIAFTITTPNRRAVQLWLYTMEAYHSIGQNIYEVEFNAHDFANQNMRIDYVILTTDSCSYSGYGNVIVE